VRIPTKGAIEGSILQEILATAMLLSDPDKTRRHGEGLLAAQPPVVEEIEEVIEYAEPEPSAIVVTPTTLTPVIAETASDSPDFTDLFDGIFDDELEPESSADDWALEVLLDKSNTDLVVNTVSDESSPSEHSEDPETVTAGDDEEADDSDPDYWF
jgi:hypothetical protein